MDIKEHLRQKLAQGETKKVIVELLSITKHDIDLYNDVIAISARHEKWLKEKHSNIESRQELEIENNKINISILAIINRLEVPKNKNRKLYIKYQHIFILILSITFSFIILIYLPTCYSKNKTTGITVFVVGKKGCTDFVLRKKGKVIMRVNRTGETKSESISDKGEAKFSGIEIGEKVTLEIDFSEPYRAMKNDSIYTISDKKSICLMVELQNLNVITGKVISDESPLPGVIVSINSSIVSTTDSLGNYTLVIPLKHQKKQQEVFFDKNGYISEKAIAYPQTKKPLNVVLDKKQIK